jgi:Mg2+ and Co2+ transporter CorA
MSMAMESGQASTTFPQRKSGTCVVMPYLTLENKEKVRRMHDQLGIGIRHPSDIKIKTNLAESHRYNTNSLDRDAQLRKAYSQWPSNEYLLEVRRTLDQFWHSNVDTRERHGDQVVQRYQEKKKDEAFSLGQGKVDLLMVDQLWIWVLEPSLIVTSFPQDWQLPRSKTPDLLSSILGELNPRNGTPAKDIYELAACIIEHCLKASDEKTDQSDIPSVTEMFEAFIAELTQDESVLADRFNAAGASASLWIKNSLMKHNTQGNEDLQEFNERYMEALGKIEPGSDHVQSHLQDDNHDTEEPLFLEHLLDIQPEISFLEGVKRVQHELRILDRIADDQHRVTSSARDTFTAMQRNESFAREPIRASWSEQLEHLQQHRNEIAYLSGRAQDIYKSVIDLLDHKQRYANAIEARYARAPARTLMVFTVVTVVFLPLSFLASFFTINIKELPYVDDQRQQLTLTFVLRYVLGIGLGTALLCVAVALYHHGFVRWMNRRRMVIWAKKQRLKLTQAVFTMEGRQSKRSGGEDSGFKLKDYASSSTLRSRRGRVRDDMEMGGRHGVR